MDRDADPRDTIARLERELRLRDEFIAIAAHELRNPLTPIALEVDILLAQARRRANPAPGDIASLERLQRSIQTFIRRAGTLLDVTRVQSGNFTLASTTVVLAELVERVLAAASPIAQAANCAVEMRADGPVIGNWDPQAVEEIVENLLSNALRYGAGAPVQVRVRNVGETAELRVIDHGIGIAAEDRERIFGRFQRGVNGASSPGFGVGLWITRELARAMLGDVTVESTPGRGATFILRLPIPGTQVMADADS